MIIDRLISAVKLPDKVLTKQLNNLNNKTKEYLVKGWILFTGVWFVLTLILGFLENDDNELGSVYLTVFTIFCVCTGIMVYLMFRIDITNNKVKPIIKTHKIVNYDEFKKILFSSLKNMKLNNQNIFEYKNDNNETMIIYNIKEFKLYCIQTIWMENFDIDILDKYTESFWSETVKNVGNEEIKYKYLNLIQFICIQRQNAQFKKFISQNIPQAFKRNQIIVGVSFGGKKAYIGKTEGLFFRKEYYILLGLVEKITKDLFYEIDDKLEKY